MKSALLHFAFLGLCGLLVLTRAHAQGPLLNPSPEVRGIWVDGFNPGIKSPEEISALIERARQARLNAVFVQVRKRGDALYHSRYEPLARDVPKPFYDPLAEVIRQAHAQNPPIAVHAWVNACAVGEPGAYGAEHVLSQHPEWRSLSDTGVADPESAKLDPGVPGAAEWIARVALDIARRYDVDGVHLDFIRYGGPHTGYAPESIARFNRRFDHTGTPAFDDPQFQQWRRDQVTALVRQVKARIAAIRPDVVVSAATIAWGDAPRRWEESSAYRDVFQDWKTWLEDGLLDLACPMTYFAADPNRNFQLRWADWVKTHLPDKATLAVATYLNSLPESLKLLRINRAPGSKQQRAAGVLFYSYNGTSKGGAREEAVYAAIGEVFAENPELPPVIAAEERASGIVSGRVFTDSDLAAADSATVTLEPATSVRGGPPETLRQTADGSGFFALIGVAPGEYLLRVLYAGEETLPRPVTVVAGNVTRADFFLQSGGLPEPRPVFGLSRVADGERVFLPDALVTSGNFEQGGDWFFLADAVGGSSVAARIRTPRPLNLPLVRDDRIAVAGVVRFERGRLVIDAEAIQVVGSRR